MNTLITTAGTPTTPTRPATTPGAAAPSAPRWRTPYDGPDTHWELRCLVASESLSSELACGARKTPQCADGAGAINFRVCTIFAGPASSWRCGRGADEGGVGVLVLPVGYGYASTRVRGYIEGAAAAMTLLDGGDAGFDDAASWCALKVKAARLVLLCKRGQAPLSKHSGCATLARLRRPWSQPAVRAFA